MIQKDLMSLKQNNLATILNTGKSYAISYAQFDPDTGERVEDKVVSLDLDALRNENISLQAQIDANNAILDAAEATPVTPPEPASPDSLQDNLGQQ